MIKKKKGKVCLLTPFVNKVIFGFVFIIFLFVVFQLSDTFQAYYDSRTEYERAYAQLEEVERQAEILEQFVMSGDSETVHITQKQGVQEIHLRGAGQVPKVDRPFHPTDATFSVYVQ